MFDYFLAGSGKPGAGSYFHTLFQTSAFYFILFLVRLKDGKRSIVN